MLKHNIYLLGFMGSGKSHIGKILSEVLDVPLIDLDAFIESEEGCTISDIFEQKGEAYFRQVETVCLRQLESARAVIALGGGTPCFSGNMPWINQTGCSFFLDPPIDVLVERLIGEQDKRPLLKGKDSVALRLFIEQKLEERRNFYEQAIHTIKENYSARIVFEIQRKMNQKLLLLHGALGSAEQLSPLKQALEPYFEVHTLNFEGHGGRATEAANFSIDCFTENVLEYLNKNKIAKIDILGYSMGGYVALNLALKHPSKVFRIFTLATKFAWSAESASKEVKMLDPVVIEKKVPAFAETLKERHAPLDWKVHLSKTAAMMLALGNGAKLSTEDFQKIQHRVLLTVGSKDRMVSEEETRAVANTLPNGTFKLLEGVKHPIEQVDVKTFSQKVVSFFD